MTNGIFMLEGAPRIVLKKVVVESLGLFWFAIFVALFWVIVQGLGVISVWIFAYLVLGETSLLKVLSLDYLALFLV